MTEGSPQRRPRNRKQLIVAAAARQFERKGFHDTSVADIAAEVGITGPALYRHFRSKSDLLMAAIELEIDQIERIYTSDTELPALLGEAAKALLRPGRVNTLWERSSPFLESEARSRLAERHLAALMPLRAALLRARSDLTEADADALTWAVHAVMNTARAFERVKVDRERGRRLMVAAATAVAEIPRLLPVAQEPAPHTPVVGVLSFASRREAALAAAVHLFAERGFQAVGMDDIGAAAGISGPTLYHHFPGKSAILSHIILRCLEALNFDLAAALSSTDDPAEALELALASFVRINVAQGDALVALTTGIVHVQEEERAPIRRAQQDYVNEWAVLLAASRKDLSQADTEALVRAAQRVIDAMRHHLPVRKTEQRQPLRRLGHAVLGIEEKFDTADLLV
ncbi:TetR/AcrR family transcriptional regulator [Rhodococcus sp. RCBS9]|uniref:TetR/AcrR family transcriptional regulator n=1 Tax=Rhodococcus sp. RCBS9 TaxID=3031999 RepID=UPI0023F8A5E0|nr:TetR/AcrR family transcriptional regulator [Rhodococcus sp. RCBS9]WEX01074.1 helix-turn-helix domain containing protein [Rhodococcus sp. RCBS9]